MGKQLTVCLFVDDILATCETEDALTDLIDQLKREFEVVKGSVSDDFSYLGMHIQNNREEGEVQVSMEGYEDELLTYAKVTGVRKSPATANLFDVGPSALLPADELAHFHTLTAKLLYLSLRARYDIAVAVSYLTTRVTCANRDDMAKLDRVLMYLNGTRGKKLTLACHGKLRVSAYVDVAFGIHDDGKSHTGTVHCIGEASVMAKSSKQKMVSKDSTEGELVGLTDKVDGVMSLSEFMEEQGHELDPPVIFQDNQSTISLVTKGGGKSRSKHLRTRQYRMKELIDNGNIVVEYLPTGSMIADVMSKPLQGTLLNFMIKKLLNEEEQIATGRR